MTSPASRPRASSYGSDECSDATACGSGDVGITGNGAVLPSHQSTEDHVSGTQIVVVALSMWLRANPDLVECHGYFAAHCHRLLISLSALNADAVGSSNLTSLSSWPTVEFDLVGAPNWRQCRVGGCVRKRHAVGGDHTVGPGMRLPMCDPSAGMLLTGRSR